MMATIIPSMQAAARINPEWRRRYITYTWRCVGKNIAKVGMGRRLAIKLYWTNIVPT
jgi:hypothetical protein